MVEDKIRLLVVFVTQLGNYTTKVGNYIGLLGWNIPSARDEIFESFCLGKPLQKFLMSLALYRAEKRSSIKTYYSLLEAQCKFSAAV